MKRIMLFVGTNLAIMLVLGVFTMLTGANRYFTDAVLAHEGAMPVLRN